MQLDIIEYALIALAAAAAGAANALAGGGTLITFPMLTAVGLTTVSANITNTTALGPGYFGAMLAQRGDLAGQRRRIIVLLLPAVLGGLLGALLLLNTSERLFRVLVPYLILLASLLLAVQEPIRNRLLARAAQGGRRAMPEWVAMALVFVATIYGGYFGAGISVIVLAVLGLVIDDSLTRLNALKHVVTFSANMAATALFLFSGEVVWLAVLIMSVAAVVGGGLGGRLAGSIKPSTLRWTVVTIGIILSIIYFVRG